jgi:hypothetical protein
MLLGVLLDEPCRQLSTLVASSGVLTNRLGKCHGVLVTRTRTFHDGFRPVNHLMQNLSLVSKRFGVMRKSLRAEELCRFHELLRFNTVAHEVAVNGGPLRSELSTELQALWRCGQSGMRSAFLDDVVRQQAATAKR